jgi:hypothetical protein
MINDNDNIFDITSRVTIHDINQFEIKLEYNMEELKKTNNYKIETYLFIPKSLQINNSTYKDTDFYHDLQNYIRFKTPTYSFKLIIDPGFIHSPLYNLKQLLSNLEIEKNPHQREREIQAAIKEIKLLGVMIRARFRDYRYMIRVMLSKPGKSSDYIINKLDEIINSGVLILQELRKIKEDYLRKCPEEKEFFRYCRVTEEFLSFLIEEEAVGIFNTVSRKIEHSECLDNIINRFKSFLKEEKKFRETNDYSLNFKNSEESKERYIHHMSQYKKIIASVLYLHIERELKNEAYIHLVGSGAAFAAALVYFIITVITSLKFAMNSIPFILILSVGYVFKDRLKDLIKVIFNPHVLSHFPDHITQIVDSSGNKKIKLGNIREKVFYANREDIDPLVLALRDKTRPAAFLAEESPENVLVYQKEINIKSELIRENHSRTINIADIMRFNIHKYLEKMDNPQQMINFYDEEKDAVSSTSGERTYHINLVVKYSKFSQKQEQIRYERYRIVTSKWGIKRVEFVEET